MRDGERRGILDSRVREQLPTSSGEILVPARLMISTGP
jgi:hypothetical protein